MRGANMQRKRTIVNHKLPYPDYDIINGPKFKDKCDHGANHYIATIFVNKAYDLYTYGYYTDTRLDGVCARYGNDNGYQENFSFRQIRLFTRNLLWQSVAHICRARGLM